MICNFWEQKECYYEEWQVAILKMLYKNKGDSKKLINYRGIVLQDVFARLTSAIVAQRLGKLLHECGIEEQFGYQKGRGTIDAVYVLRTTLQLRKLHRMDSHVLFVDLIKANKNKAAAMLSPCLTPTVYSMLHLSFPSLNSSLKSW